MIVLRAIFRFTVFVIAVAAIVVILGAGFWAFSTQDEAAAASISVGDASVVRSPQNIEEFFLGFYLQSQSEKINTPVSNDPSTVPFTIESGETGVSVSEKLAEQQFITDPDVFRLFLRYNGLDSSLEAGDYVLRRNMNMREIAEALQKANFEEIAITIPEGLRAEEIAELLTEANIMDGSEFLAAVRQGTVVDHPLLADRPPGASYEGYLFPDTYRLPALNTTPEDLIGRMLDNMAQKIPADALALASAQGYTFYQILTVASIVEREAVVPDERPAIASVYLNRLGQGMYLQADPTVQYAMGYQTDTDQWWKTPVTLEEYSQVNSPYNTYMNPGLPPGPIANPGASSINATLQPAQTNYLFFMGCGGEGAHVFAEDFNTHEANVAACQ
ncbi:MAG TPA: endolytic transglycosylase MltG [Anaerolineae bacterium]|nr:endolytic transglycosylase MltG [Anaerolineae bacterium]MCB0222198.1 endolytic transglycosylase MltG [Anaerolineae bacterium]MCB9107801.1 endolytic transglycosylase MltG [Anaerolineales bacterium]HRV90858.1 endolytic transglycosylase MltG [Anaerolineae bacterium]